MPHNRNLLKYIWQSKQKGIPDTEIKKILEDNGWNYADIERAFKTVGGTGRRFLHLHIFHRHVPLGIAVLILILSTSAAALTPFYLNKIIQPIEIMIPGGETAKIKFTYGSWPALENTHFFESVKRNFISEKADFIEADISAMKLRAYKEGILVKEAPIASKGKEGSWWETPAGIYKIENKEESHYSSFGHVYMPWSMQFQGNFFIHGYTYYPDGTPTSRTYSGGCIRLSTADAEEIFKIVNTGTPVLVFEKSFTSGEAENTVAYAIKKPALNAASYLAADLENNFVFAEIASKEQRSIASLAKLMTALIAVEYINVERDVTFDASMAATTSIPRLHIGDRASILDLLSLLLTESSNEAALAITAPIGKNRFIDLMNKKAEAIGMKKSHFLDTSGIKSENISTVEDLFLLAKYLYYNRSFILHMSMNNENRIAYGPSRFRNLSNFNKLSDSTELIGGKIGLSAAAGESMLTIFEIEMGGKKRPIVIIVLGSDDSKRDIMSLKQYIQSNYVVIQENAYKISAN